MLLEILKIYRTIDGNDSANVAAALYFLSSLYIQRGELQKAETCLKRALEMKLRLVSPTHVDVAACYSNLALCHRLQGKFVEAKEEFQRALDILLPIRGSNHEGCMKLIVDIEICALAIEGRVDLEMLQNAENRTKTEQTY